MKDERTHYDAVDKSESEPQFCGSASVLFIVRKSGPILVALVGLAARWEAVK